MYMRALAEAWPLEAIVQQPVGQVPRSHDLVLLTKLKDPLVRLAYPTAAVEHGWSRNVLAVQIEMRSVERQGKAVTNFDRTLPAAQSDLARESLKDPYKLDFLGLDKDAREREIEQALVDHVADFLLELGAGFAYVGRQVHLEVGGDDFFIDLLFYHHKLRSYVVIEIKAGKFKPDHVGSSAST
jgi:predicted nuclease of restriction endonuclease-like (RecB) superfamily